MRQVFRNPEWRQKLLHELIEYWLTVLYLSVYFGVFTVYRRLILANYNITYLNYGVAIIEALILAKVILVGDLLRLGLNFQMQPLAIPTLFRSAVFTVFVALFTLSENTVRGLFRGEGWSGGFHTLVTSRIYEFLASALVVFVTFIPFFAFKELNRVLGKGKVWNLFFRDRGGAPTNSHNSPERHQ